MKLTALQLDSVEDFIETLPETDKAKAIAAILSMENGDFESVYTKTLKGQLRELRVKRMRFIFFTHEQIIYIVYAFTKKTNKTPIRYIENSEEIYKLITKDL